MICFQGCETDQYCIGSIEYIRMFT
jgi:hypothetical protein